jgi:hypothetical protein
MIESIQGMVHNLQTFAGSVTFATGDNSLGATGIGTSTFSVGEKVTVSGSASNNKTFTITNVTANKLLVAETVTAEGPVACTVAEEWQGSGFAQAFHVSSIVGVITASQSCTGYLDFSNDRTNADLTKTYAVTGGTPLAINETVLAPYVKFRLKNGSVNQTACKGYVSGLRY